MRVYLLALYSFISLTTNAQNAPWSVYAGAAATYDGFFRDASVTSVKNKWPFMVGGDVIIGAGYKADNGFDLFAEATIGFVNLKMPMPPANQAALLNMFSTRLMAGSGPRIPTGTAGNSITPFVQLGGSYLNNLGSSTSGGPAAIHDHDNNITDSWLILFGGGIDWHFYGKIASSINLNFSYTPLNIFKEPYHYTVTSAKSVDEVSMQGKLMQVVLSYRIHLGLGKNRD